MPLRPLPVEKITTDEPVSDPGEPAREELQRTVEAALPEPSETLEKQPSLSLAMGPFLNSFALTATENFIRALGIQVSRQMGRGPVEVIRLEEGVYPEAEAMVRLTQLRQQVKSAFLLPRGELKVLYAASFTDKNRAVKMVRQLAQQHINVRPVTLEVTLDGPMLMVENLDQATKETVVAGLRKKNVPFKFSKQD